MLDQQRNKVRTHWQNNKKVYVACATTAVGTAGLVLYTMVRRGEDPLVQNILNFMPRTEVNKVTIDLIERSTPSRPVHLKGTNLYFNSLNEAARQTGHSLTKISKQVNGHIPDVNGDVFEVLEAAA